MHSITLDSARCWVGRRSVEGWRSLTDACLRDEKCTMTTPAIHTEGLSKRYGAIEALVDLDLVIEVGEVVGYLGPNGAGKTTTIRLLLDLARPTAGRAEIFGLDTSRHPSEVHRRSGYVPGDVNLWPELTGEETLHLLGRMHRTVDEAYRNELIERFDLDPTRKVRASSTGNRQKIVIIAALMGRPDLLILDEPSSGLDPLNEHEIRRCILEAKERGQTVLLSSHQLSEVEAVCDRVAILHAGRLVEHGTLAELRGLDAVCVDVTFAGEAPDLTTVPGVQSVSRTPGPAPLEPTAQTQVQIQVRGTMQPLLAALAAAGATGLRSREASLEELFLARYGTGGGDRPR